MLEYELRNAKALVEKFKERLRAQGRQEDRNDNGQGKALKSTIVQQAIAGASTTREQRRR